MLNIIHPDKIFIKWNEELIGNYVAFSNLICLNIQIIFFNRKFNRKSLTEIILIKLHCREHVGPLTL